MISIFEDKREIFKVTKEFNRIFHLQKKVNVVNKKHPNMFTLLKIA